MAKGECHRCGQEVCECDTSTVHAVKLQSTSMMSVTPPGGFQEDGGYARWEGQIVFWDKDDPWGNVINIFPGGMPPRSHYTHDHDHIKVRGASVAVRGGTTCIVGGYVAWSRIGGVEH